MNASPSRGVAGRARGLWDRVRRTPLIATGLAVQKRYSEDSAGFLAAGITYYAFLSLFPLLLLALAALGYVLASQPQAQADWTLRISQAVPGLGALVGDNLSSVVRHRAGTGIAGLAGLAWAGRGVAAAAMHGLARVFPFDETANVVVKQAWLLGALLGLGLLALVSAGAAAGSSLTRATRAAGPAITLALDFVMFLAAYRILTMRRGPRLRALWRGAALAAAGWTVLKIGGAWYATKTVAGAEAVYGTFAGTVGVLVLLYLASRLFMYGAELNAVFIEREVLVMRARKTDEPDITQDGGRSTLEIVRSIADDTATLVRKEAELARMEIVEAVTARIKSVAAMGAAGTVALVGVAMLALALAAALAMVLPAWASALISGGAMFVLAGAAVLFARVRMKRPSLKPEETVRTVREDVEWTRELFKR